MPDVVAVAREPAPTALEQAQTIAGDVLRVPRPWTGLMLVVALLSSLHLTVTSRGAVSGSFGLSALTGILLALIWLPALLKVITLAGGGVKTPAGEASTGGLLGVISAFAPERKREALPPLLAALTSPEVLADPAQRTAAEPIRRDLEIQFASATLPATGVREKVAAYAREYERLRTTPASDQRTYRMTTLMAEARAIARAAPLPFIDIRNMLENGSDGERVIALAITQDQPDIRLFPLILNAITDSRSAFEQYQALGAALEVLPMIQLDSSRQGELRKALTAAVENERNGIEQDTSRLMLVQAIEDSLGRS